MKRAIPPPTKAESDRLRRISDYGCIISRLKWRIYVPAEIHHLNDCGRNMGHWWTIPLAPWYHRGICHAGMPQREMTRVYGPSMDLDREAFDFEFGGDRRLWIVVQRLFGWDRTWPASKIFRRSA